MKNASFLLMYCILLAFVLSIFIKLYKTSIPPNTTNDTYMIKILNTNDNKIITMSLEEYVWRVAAKEMPIHFHDEAIKAQIVVARTYALKKLETQAHENGADVCSDHNHCTAFLLPGEEETLFSQNHESYSERLKSLAAFTEGQILTYDSQPILAVFHAISSGVTEKSSDIWQSQLPYLINVDSSVDKTVDGFSTEKTFSENELKTIFNITEQIEFEIIDYTNAGSVKNIKVCKKNYTGSEIRNLLSLRSNHFTIKKENDIYTFYVKGYGHGVGMSQNGANEFAKIGSDYKEILMKYYPGTKINNLYSGLNPTK